MNRKLTRKDAAYHHGDLRNALLQAALAMLERDGLERLSLRAVSAAVGVSHAAPAHHFGSLKGLRNALAMIGYERFAASMADARRLAPPDPAAQMRAAARGYLAFALSSPALFRLMFTADLLDWSDAQLKASASASRRQLTEVCEPAAARLKLDSQSERLALERLVWSDIHGRAHLTIDGQFGGPPCDDVSGGHAEIDIAALLFGGGGASS